jgi:hypothetical protein
LSTGLAGRPAGYRWRMSQDRQEQFNTHTAPPLEAENVPPEEELSPAEVDDQLDQDPEEVPNRVAAPEVHERQVDPVTGETVDPGDGAHRH